MQMVGIISCSEVLEGVLFGMEVSDRCCISEMNSSTFLSCDDGGEKKNLFFLVHIRPSSFPLHDLENFPYEEA